VDPLLGPPNTPFETTINQNTLQWSSHHHGSLQQQQQQQQQQMMQQQQHHYHHHLPTQMPNTNLTQQLQSGSKTIKILNKYNIY
jgi:hypothetical protein